MYGSVNTAGISQEVINAIKSGADNAVNLANAAQNTANQAVALANTAQSSANAAKTAADNVQANLTNHAANANQTYAPKASPTFTGTPKVPTPGNGADNSQIANVAYVLAQMQAMLQSIPEFVSPTSSTAGKAGLVPMCPKGTDTWLFTSEGWKKSTDTVFYVGSEPTQKGTLTYSGNAQTPTWNNLDVNKIAVSGTTQATNAGTYSAIFTPRGLYVWADGTQSPREIFWTIAPKTYAKPSAAVKTFTYSGSEQTLNVTNYNSSVMNQTGTVKATAKGAYSVTYALKDKDNTAWADNTTADVKIDWNINVKTYAKPTAATKSFTYDKQAHTLNISNYDSNVMSQTGTTSATVKGDYSVKYVLKDKTNTAWADNSTTDVTIDWTIAIRKLTKPSASTTSYTYTGNAITIAVSNIDTNYMTESGTRSSTNVATGLTVKYTLSDKTNTCWADNSTNDVTITWNITRAKLTAAQSTFSQSGSLTYNGSAQSPTISNYNSAYHVLGGVTSKTDVGTYTATVTPDSNHAWNDGTFAVKNVSWSIGLLKIAKPTASKTSYACTGVAQTLSVSNFNSSYISASNNSKTAPGNYTANYALSNSLNVVWADNSTDDIQIAWEITIARLTKPTLQKDTFSYNDNNQSVTLNNFNSNLMNISGNTQKNVGNYTATVSLKNTNYATWADNSTGNVNLAWKIEKAQGSLTLYNTSDVVVPYRRNYDIVRFTKTGGDLKVTTNNNYVSVSVVGDRLVLYQEAGNCTTKITVSVQETDGYTASSAQTFTVTGEQPVRNLKARLSKSKITYGDDVELIITWDARDNLKYNSTDFVYVGAGANFNYKLDGEVTKDEPGEYRRKLSFTAIENDTSFTDTTVDAAIQFFIKAVNGYAREDVRLEFTYNLKTRGGYELNITYATAATVGNTQTITRTINNSPITVTIPSSARPKEDGVSWNFAIYVPGSSTGTNNKKVAFDTISETGSRPLHVSNYPAGSRYGHMYYDSSGESTYRITLFAAEGYAYKQYTFTLKI